MLINLHEFFTSCSWRNTNSKYWTLYGSWL